MARRTGRQSNQQDPNPTAEATAEAPTQEDAVTTATAEAPAETPTDQAPVEGDTSTEAKAEEKPIDLTAFNAAVAAAVAEADTTTGEVPTEQLAKVTEAYRALDGAKAKNAAKKTVNDGMKDAMASGSLPRARAHMMIGEDALVAGGGSKSASTPADPTEAFVQRVAGLSLAYNLATSNVPEGVNEDWNERVNTLVAESIESARAHLAWTTGDEESRGEEPEASAFVKAAVKLSVGKAARVGGGGGGTRAPFTGERGDIGKHIAEAFADKPVGTFLKIADIRNFKSSEYEAGKASAGAISARLFPGGNGEKSSMNKLGIKPDTQDGKKGATKVSDAPEA